MQLNKTDSHNNFRHIVIYVTEIDSNHLDWAHNKKLGLSKHVRVVISRWRS